MRDNFLCNSNALSAACKVQEESIHVEHPILKPAIAALRVARKGRKVEMYCSTSRNAERQVDACNNLQFAICF